MPMHAAAFSKPTSILLATDLSARSDRARERAMALAREWQAELVVLTVLPKDANFSLPNAFVEPQEFPAGESTPPSPASVVREQAERDFADLDLPHRIHVAEGEVGAAAMQAARETGSGLIVVGCARTDALRRMQVGSSVEWLSRHATLPVLVVQERVRSPYRHVAVASDFSQAGEVALHLADAWFADAQRRTLLHGYEVSTRTLAASDERREQALAAAQQQAQAQGAAYLAAALGPRADAWNTEIHPNNPVRLAREFARAAGVDLTVMASHGRSGLLDRLIGSVAKRLLETAYTDVLVVRTPVP